MDERICWICRSAPATRGGEHKWPRAYLDRHHPDWSEVIHGDWRGDIFHTQSAKSRNLKVPVLCASCNNDRTADQDRALNAFLIHIEGEEREVWDERVVDLDHNPDRHLVLDLYRALMKMEFSRLADDGVPILDAVADFVAGSPN